MLETCGHVVILICGTLALSSALADTTYLANGSRIEGRVVSLSEQQITLRTPFADALVIPREQVAGLTTEEPRTTDFVSGERAQTQFLYQTDSATQVLEIDGRTSVRTGERPLSTVAAVGLEVVDDAETQTAEVAPQSDSEAPAADYWSGHFEFALNGNSGNTDSQSLYTLVSALRDTGDTRLDLAASIDRQEEDKVKTASEYLGTARFEKDINKRLFWFAQQELRKDEFEDLDLQSRTLFGPGLFIARRDRLTFKIRGGLGYQYEQFTSGGTDSALIFAAGWDYKQLIGDSLKLTHGLTIYPELTNSPTDNYTLESLLGVELPIADATLWSVRAAWGHEYSSNPEPGLEKLDTSYRVGIAREF